MAAERKRQRRKEARPSEIVDAGLAEFAEKGFAATRLVDVARRAGISKATIYLYFPSKEALFEAAIRERLVSTMEGMAAVTLSFDGTTEELFGELLKRVYDRLIAGNSSVLLRVLIAEGHRFPELVAFYRQVAIARGMQVVEGILARGVARGEVRPSAAATDPRIILAPAVLAAIWSNVFLGGESFDRETFAKAHLELVMRGILLPR